MDGFSGGVGGAHEIAKYYYKLTIYSIYGYFETSLTAYYSCAGINIAKLSFNGIYVSHVNILHDNIYR